MAKEMNDLQMVMISGYYGFDNCGDEAILSVIINELSQYIPRTKLIILSRNPLKTKKTYQVNAINRLNYLLIIAKMVKTGIFISGGGGLLQDISGKGFSIWYYLSLLFLARIFDIPCVIYAQGIGPVKRTVNRKIVSWIFNRVNLIMVRDHQSKILLQEMGIRDKSIAVSADPSFLLLERKIPASLKKKYQLDQHGEKANKEMVIGLAIRNCKEIELNYEHKVRQFAEIADYLITEYQAKLFFLSFQKNSDYPFVQDVAKRMEQNSFVCLEEEISPNQMLSLFSEFSLIVGMRFHSIIFSTMKNKPFIAIAYDPKVEFFVRSLGVSELLINLQELTIKNMDNKLKYIAENRKMIQTALKEKKEIFQGEASSSIQQLLHFIQEES